jgi:hypothetical protein
MILDAVPRNAEHIQGAPSMSIEANQTTRRDRAAGKRWRPLAACSAAAVSALSA